MDELEKFLNRRSVGLAGGVFYWVGPEVPQESFILLTQEETFRFLTLTTRAYRESLVSKP